MNQPSPDPLNGVAPDLAGAIRRARLEEAQRSDAVAEIRSAEIARLALLHDAVRPILAQVPRHIDVFDAAISYGDHPRLFIDMIGFVELRRDSPGYRLIQDTRHGRIVMAETDGLDTTLDAVADYVARRLVEREKALAADTTAACPVSATPPPIRQGRNHVAMTPPSPTARARRRRRGWFAASLRFVVEFLGTVTLIGILLGAGFLAYHAIRAWLAAHHGFAPE